MGDMSGSIMLSPSSSPPHIPMLNLTDTTPREQEQEDVMTPRRRPLVEISVRSSRAVTNGAEVSGGLKGQFLSWGCGEFGQHGHGHTDSEVVCRDGLMDRFSGEITQRVKFAACGSSHTIVVTNSNDIYAWGNGNSGQLGCGDKESQVLPTRIQLYSTQPENPKVRGVACGGRHSYVWLHNGHMFSFGNNFFAQLGYDFRVKNYKENQVKPHLLRTMAYRCVVQVACGEKHSAFLFQGGQVAVVGNSSVGQIGHGSREEATVPRYMEDALPPIRLIACGGNHTLAIDENNEVWTWGYGKACGHRRTGEDVLFPEKIIFPRPNIIMVAGGQQHSMALTANGSVYSWGCGHDGQLGHGERIKFLTVPRKITHPELRGHVTYISCGDSYSAAVTDGGVLYMWGKNSHVITPGRPSNYRVFEPVRIDTGVHGGIGKVECGSWHAVAVTGTATAWTKHDDQSDGEEDSVYTDGDTESTLSTETEYDLNGKAKDKAMNIAEFYASTPSEHFEERSPSPVSMCVSPSIRHPRLPSSLHRRASSSSSSSASRPSRHSPDKPPLPPRQVSSALLLKKPDWRPDESTQDAIKDIQIYLPSARTPEPNEDENLTGGKFNVTFYMKDSADGAKIPSGAQESSLPGNRKAVTFEIAEKFPASIINGVAPQGNLFVSRKNFPRRPVYAGMVEEGPTNLEQHPDTDTILPQQTEPGKVLAHKRVELMAASTFIIDKNWDMYNTHMKKVSGAKSASTSTQVSMATSAISMSGGNKMAAAGDSPSKKSSQAPVIALRRAKSVLAGQNAKANADAKKSSAALPAYGSSHPSTNNADNKRQHLQLRKLQNTSSSSFVPSAPSILSCPSTVSFISSPPPIASPPPLTSLPPPRSVSIPGRRRGTDGGTYYPALTLEAQPPRHRPMYSSATSWKNEKDRALGIKMAAAKNSNDQQRGFEGHKNYKSPRNGQRKVLLTKTGLVPPPLADLESIGTLRTYSTVATEGTDTDRTEN